jgi:hypothetical protein
MQPRMGRIRCRSMVRTSTELQMRTVVQRVCAFGRDSHGECRQPPLHAATWKPGATDVAQSSGRQLERMSLGVTAGSKSCRSRSAKWARPWWATSCAGAWGGFAILHATILACNGGHLGFGGCPLCMKNCRTRTHENGTSIKSPLTQLHWVDNVFGLSVL